MPHRVLNVVWALATCIPVLAQAQQSLGPMSGAQREGSWELSVGAGAVYLDNRLISVVRISDASAKRVVPGGVLRLGYNLGKMWSLSVGTFAGYAKPATVLQPFGAISWTPNVDRRTSPFLILGGGLTRISWQGSWVTSQFGVHLGFGIRQMLSERMALRVEVREQYEKYSDATTFPNAVFNGTATVGLSFFLGGRRAPAAGVAAAPPAPAPTPEAAAPAQPAMTLGIVPPSDTLTALGQAVQLSVVAQDADNNAIASPRVAWMSSNAAAVTVDASGLATAVRNGTATITATTARGRAATATVTVAQAIASVSVSPPTASIKAPGGRAQFTAQATDANGRPVTGKVITWSGSAPDVAAVSATGQATAVSNGTAQITATVEGQTGSATLTVAIPVRAALAPAAPAAELPAVNATVVLKNVIFRPNSSVLPPEASTDLDAVAQAMQAIPHARWEIGGYTSNMGKAERNQLLSRRRALAVRAYLVRQGVPATRLVAVGYGSQNPVASNATVAGRRQNMRVEIKRLR